MSEFSRSRLYNTTMRKRVQQLPLVFVDALHLAIKDAVRVNALP